MCSLFSLFEERRYNFGEFLGIVNISIKRWESRIPKLKKHMDRVYKTISGKLNCIPEYGNTISPFPKERY